MVDARDLHRFLKSKRDFSTWIKDKLEKYGFVINEDFATILGKTSFSGGRPAIEYFLTINTAKEISMVKNNEQGKKARKKGCLDIKKINMP